MYISHSVSETEQIAASLAQKTPAPHVFCLKGDLGAGKTAFSRGLVSGYGNTSRVSSPTFTIMNVYEGTPPIYHFDLYRLESEDDLYDIGADSYFESGICIVEWPDNFMQFFENATLVTINRGEKDDEREIIIEEIKK